jgi:hypothetical protein
VASSAARYSSAPSITPRDVKNAPAGRVIRFGFSQWVLTVGYPGGKTRQVSLRPEQVPLVQKAIEEYRDFKQTLEAISELNQFLLRLDREESKDQERAS